VGSLEVEVRPASPYRLPRGSSDGTLRIQGGVARRLLRVEDAPVLVRAWQPARDRLLLRAEAVPPAALRFSRDGLAIRAAAAADSERRAARAAAADSAPAPANRAQLGAAIERMRFALGVDYDLAEFHRRFRLDPLLRPLIRRYPHFRPLRAPWPWEALASAVVKQLIESSRAALIERRIVGRWGARLGDGPRAPRDTAPVATIAGRAPAELQAMDLSAGRSVALRRLARDVVGGRLDPGDPGADRRLLATPEIGPWTVQCLALFGRGEMDSLPAGDLGYIKLVGHLAGLGRRATVPEVEEFYAPYEPFRGLAGCLTLSGLHRLTAGPPLRLAA
jgi:3-methyladenine DNA glycosylase/8-oxoguanine DNA glycosylase